MPNKEPVTLETHPISAVSNKVLIAEMLRREIISEHSAILLEKGLRLEEAYRAEASHTSALSGRALSEAIDRLGRGELDEAVLQLGRAHPGLSNLPDLFERALAARRTGG